MDKQSRIIRAMELNGILSTSDIAEHSGIPLNECESMLVDMEENEQVFNVSDNDWMLK